MAVKVKLAGGLGNQLFQLAFGLLVARTHGAPLHLETSFFSKKRHRSLEIGAYLDGETLFDEYTPFKGVGHNEIRPPPHTVPGLFHEPVHGVFIDPADVPLDRTLIGYWQNARYPLLVRDELLRRTRQAEQALPEAARRMFAEIEGRESVAIHVRRGDYLRPEALACHGLCLNSYFRTAVDAICERLKQRGIARRHIAFYVFTDSPDIVKRHVTLPRRSIMVSGKGLAPCEELALIRAAKHCIISNSTFGWWGAWLSESPQKIVVRPVPWYADSDFKELSPSDWLTAPRERKRAAA